MGPRDSSWGWLVTTAPPPPPVRPERVLTAVDALLAFAMGGGGYTHESCCCSCCRSRGTAVSGGGGRGGASPMAPPPTLPPPLPFPLFGGRTLDDFLETRGGSCCRKDPVGGVTSEVCVAAAGTVAAAAAAAAPTGGCAGCCAIWYRIWAQAHVEDTTYVACRRGTCVRIALLGRTLLNTNLVVIDVHIKSLRFTNTSFDQNWGSQKRTCWCQQWTLPKLGNLVANIFSKIQRLA